MQTTISKPIPQQHQSSRAPWTTMPTPARPSARTTTATATTGPDPASTAYAAAATAPAPASRQAATSHPPPTWRESRAASRPAAGSRRPATAPTAPACRSAARHIPASPRPAGDTTSATSSGDDCAVHGGVVVLYHFHPFFSAIIYRHGQKRASLPNPLLLACASRVLAELGKRAALI